MVSSAAALTKAERAILALAASDVPRAEIAQRRGVKPSTVKKQVQSILAKTGARSLEHAALRIVLEQFERATSGLSW